MSGRNTPVPNLPELEALDALNTEQRLDYLQHLLLQLPKIPVQSKDYRFHKHKMTPGDIAVSGSLEASVLEAIEGTFGRTSDYDEDFVEYTERGEGLDALVPFLRSGLGDTSQKHVQELLRWVDIFLSSAIVHFVRRKLPIPASKRAPKPKLPFDARLALTQRNTPSSRASSPALSRAGSPAPRDGTQSGERVAGAKRPADGDPSGEPAKRSRAGEEESNEVSHEGTADAPLVVDSGDESDDVRALGACSTRRRVLVVGDDVEMGDGHETEGESAKAAGSTAPKNVAPIFQRAQTGIGGGKGGGGSGSTVKTKKPSQNAPQAAATSKKSRESVQKKPTASTERTPKPIAKKKATKAKAPTQDDSDAMEVDEDVYEEDEDGEEDGSQLEECSDDGGPVPSKKAVKAARSDATRARKLNWMPPSDLVLV